MKFNVIALASLLALTQTTDAHKLNGPVEIQNIQLSSKDAPNETMVTQIAQKLGIPMSPELMQMGDDESTSSALVEIAVGMGKSPEEISAAVGM